MNLEDEAERPKQTSKVEEMTITAHRLRAVLDYDAKTGVFRHRSSRGRAPAGAIAGTLTTKGYRNLRIDGAMVQAHRAAWLYVYGEWPHQVIDHIDHDTANNAIANLRDVSRAVNLQNQRRPKRDGTSGYLGVSWHVYSERWRATIVADKRHVHIGLYDTPGRCSRSLLGGEAPNARGMQDMTLTPAGIAIMVLVVSLLAYVARAIWETVHLSRLLNESTRLKAEAEE